MALLAARAEVWARLAVEDHAFVIADPDALARPDGAGPRWWLVRERLLAAMGAGRIAPVVTGFAPAGVAVEARLGGSPLAGGRKAWRFALEARRGRLWIGDPGHPYDGTWIEPGPGRFVADVQLAQPGRYRVRLAPAPSWPLPSSLPDLSPGPRRLDPPLVRPAAVEALVERVAREQAPAQEVLHRRLGRHDAFHLDLERGELTLLRKGEPTVRVAAHPIASLGDRGGFRWAWANPTLAAPLRRRSLRVRAVGLKREIRWLTDQEVMLPADDVRRLVALGARAMGLLGHYPAPYERGVLFVALDGPAPTAFSN